MAKWSKVQALEAKCSWFDSRTRHIFLFLNFRFLSSQLGKADTNEIKHDISSKVIGA